MITLDLIDTVHESDLADRVEARTVNGIAAYLHHVARHSSPAAADIIRSCAAAVQRLDWKPFVSGLPASGFALSQTDS